MNTHRHLIITVVLIIIGVIVLLSLFVYWSQIANEREACRRTKLDQMSYAEYQYCSNLLYGGGR